MGIFNKMDKKYIIILGRSMDPQGDMGDRSPHSSKKCICIRFTI